MKKFKFLYTNSLVRKLKSKAFIITQIIMSVLMLGITLIPAIITLTNKDKPLPTYQMLLISNSSYQSEIEDYLISTTKNYYQLEIEFKDNNYQNDLDNFYLEDDYRVIIHLDVLENNLANITNVNFYSKLSSNNNLIIQNSLVNMKYIILNLEHYYINIDFIEDPNITVTDDQLDMFIMGISTVVFLAIFLFLVFSVQTLGAEILEEKSTKAIETIISSVPAKTHFYSKILSSITFTFIQMVIMLVVSIVGTTISSIILKENNTTLNEMLQIGNMSHLNMPVIIIYSLIGVILGILLYLIYFAFLASFANNNEEYQKYQSPLMVILLIIFYGSMGLATANLMDVIRWLSYIPIFTPFLLPIALLSGKVLLLEGLLILIILGGFVYFSTRLITPIYRISILDYSGGKLFKSIKRSFKSRRNN